MRFIGIVVRIAMTSKDRSLDGFETMAAGPPEAYIEAILGIVPDALVSFGESGKIGLFNPAAEQLFRATSQEARKRTIWSFLTEQGSAELAAVVAHSAEKMTSPRRPRPSGFFAKELSANRNDGKVIPIQLRLSAFSLGEDRKFVAHIRDLTSRKAETRRTERLQAELMHVSRLVTMGDMASTLAHELNQPLTALGAYLEGAIYLLTDSKDDKCVRAVDAMRKATMQVYRAADVIRGLREFVGRGETEKQAESLAAIVDDVLALIRVVEKGRSIDILVVLDPDADLVLVNRTQIQQVLLNLVRNGLDAMSDLPTRRLTITSEKVAGDMVCVRVIDWGAGIAPAVADKLFQPFVTTKDKGLGVGLSISRTIVEAHGGKLSTMPNSEGGTVFQFTLRSGLFSDESGGS